MSLTQLQERIQNEVFTSPANVVVKVLGYSTDKQFIFVQNVSLDNNYHSGDTGLPEYLKVSLEDLSDDTVSSLRGERKTLAERSNIKDISYVKGDFLTGGVVILSGVTLHPDQVEEHSFELNDGETTDAIPFTIASCRWLESGGRDTERKGHIKAFLGAAMNVHFKEANERNPNPFGMYTALLIREAVECKTLEEVENATIKQFNAELAKLVPAVYVRINDGSESFGYMLRSESRKIGQNEYETLYGRDALEHTKKTHQKIWKAITLMFDVVEANPGIKVEVIPGFVEYMSSKQIKNSRLFNSQGQFIDKSKRDYYTKHWTITDDNDVKTRAFYESHCIIRYIEEHKVWTFTAHKPVKMGTDSFLGSAKMLPTANFNPGAQYKGVIQKFIDSKYAEKTESDNESSVASELGNTGETAPEPFSPDDSEMGEFVPEPMTA